MVGPMAGEHRNVAVFEDAFTNCQCAQDGAILNWEPDAGTPVIDTGSESLETYPIGSEVRRWMATCVVCKVSYRLQWILQRPSDHSTPYGYVSRIEEAP